MKPIVLCLAILAVLSCPSRPGEALSLDVQMVHIHWAVYRFNVEESIERACLRMENGRKGSEAGFNPIPLVDSTNALSSDVASYADPTMPQGASQHARLARRIIRHTQRWIFDNPKRREEWLEEWAKSYLGGGKFRYKDENGKEVVVTGDKANYLYYRELSKIWKQEREAVKQRDRGDGFNPVIP